MGFDEFDKVKTLHFSEPFFNFVCLTLKQEAMKKSILLFIIAVIAKITFSNPIIDPPVISEIYFSGGTIQIEFYFQAYWWYNNFDEFNLVSSSDTVEFNDGIDISFEEIMVLNENDLKTSFQINVDGDEIYIIDDLGYIITYTEYSSLKFGNFPGALVPAPTENQSIAYAHIYTPIGNYSGYFLGLEQPPTVGMNELSINAKGDIMGVIYDLNNNPIPDVEIRKPYVTYPGNIPFGITNSDGLFHLSELICRNYSSIKCTFGNCTEYFSATVLPNDTTWVEIQMDTLMVGLPEYSNYPNPILNFTNFSINIPDDLKYSSGYLNIYNVAGKRVDKIEITNRQQEISWNSRNVNPGIYIYNLVLDEKTFASKKMIVQ